MAYAWLLLISLCSAVPLRVLIDPGHGGKDRGAVLGQTQESQITLSVGQKLLSLLQHDKRFAADLTRNDDTALTLYRRAALAKAKSADLFLSIHVNSSPDVKAKGAEFYFQNQLPPDQESMFLAHQENVTDEGESHPPLSYAFLDQKTYAPEVAAILNDLLDGDRIWRSSQLSKALKLAWRGSRKGKANSVRQAPFFVLNQMRTPSSLVELGFLTNPEDFSQLIRSSVQQKMAEDLYHGLVAYKESLDKPKANP